MANLIDTLKKVIADAKACISESDYAAVEAVLRPIVGELYTQKKGEMVSVVRKAADKVLAAKGYWRACPRCNHEGYWVRKADGRVMNGYVCKTCGGCGVYSTLTGCKNEKKRMNARPKQEVVLTPVVKEARTKVEGISISILQDLHEADIMIAIWDNGLIGRIFRKRVENILCIQTAINAVVNVLSQVRTPIMVIVELGPETDIICNELKSMVLDNTLINVTTKGLVVEETEKRHMKIIADEWGRMFPKVEVVEPREDYVEEPYREVWIDADNIFP